MQTFLPSTSFEQSAKWLDTRRLGKQRVECYQILQALTNPDYGWQNHPAVNMWRPYPMMLTVYAMEICDEWTNRGYRDSCKEKITQLAYDNGVHINDHWANAPRWLTEGFASNHRSILLGKANEACEIGWLNINFSLTSGIVKDKHYRKYKKAVETWEWYCKIHAENGWTELPAQRVNNKWPYIWPINV